MSRNLSGSVKEKIKFGIKIQPYLQEIQLCT